MLMRVSLLLATVVLPGPVGSLRAQSDTGTVRTPPAGTRPVLRAVRREGAIALDGRLDERGWQAAPPFSAFTQSYPNPGRAGTDPTEVRVLYDDAALYVGVRMFDAQPQLIASQLARRDASGIYSDWVHVIVDSYHDRRTAFRFTVNPRGVQKDVYTSNDFNEDVNWDAVWEVGTRIDSAGWTAEFRIPYSQIRFGSAPPGVERVWGFQVMRDVARRNERVSFAPWTPESTGFVSVFGDLTGLTGVPAPSRLEVVPYVSGKITRAPGDTLDPFFEATDASPSVGADVRWGIPGGLTLTATVNPDFGQVEVDPAVVNLSAFETFFPEKRPFFLEASDVFDFGDVRRQNDYGSQIFLYSRRIGRSPQRFAGGSGVAFFDAPDQTTILGAAKVTGKYGPWTIGLLDAVTDEETARVDSATGTRIETPVEPRTNYLAARGRRDFRQGQSVAGAMVTHTVRDLGDDLGVFDTFLTSNALFGGVDFEHSWANRQWTVSGFSAMSRVAGDERAIAGLQRSSIRYYQRPDADHVELDTTRSSLAGHFSELALAKSGPVFGSIAMKYVSPGFEMNDMGFHGRMDYRTYSDLIGYQSSRAGRVFRSYNAFAYSNHAWNTDDDVIFRAYAARAQGTFNSFWWGSVGGGFAPAFYHDRLTRGGPIALVPRSWNVQGDLASDSRKPVVVSAGARYNVDASGAWTANSYAGIDSRPTSSIRVRLEPGLNVQRSRSQWIRNVDDATATATYGRRHVFADLRQVTLSLDTRIEWTLTSKLSLQTYLQPFVSAGRFSRYKEFEQRGTFDFAVYGSDRGTIARDPATSRFTVDPDGAGPAASFTFRDPTFNVRSLRGNAVLRWEYRPGSALFLVWQQERSDFAPIGDFEVGRDVGAIFRTVPTNILLLKATWWLSR